MFGDRWKITLELVLGSALHLGSGATQNMERRDAGTDETSMVQLLSRNADGAVVIPSTSLKGVLVSASTLETAEREVVFGAISDHDEERGRIGQLWCSSFTSTGTPPVRPSTGTEWERTDSYLRYQVSIARDTGAAAAHQLFVSEQVAAGTRFGGELIWWCEVGADNEVEAARVGRALAPIFAASGISLGRGTAKGLGRARADKSTLKIERGTVDPTSLDLTYIDDAALAAAVVKAAQAQAAATRPPPTLHLSLQCDGPYISMQERRRGRAVTGEAQETKPVEHDGAPVLWGTSLIGALRERAAWLAEFARARGDQRFAPGRAVDMDMDDRTLEQVLPETRAVQHLGDVAGLSSVERLFGVAGWGAQLVLERLAATSEQPGEAVLPGLRIDRLTGGGIDKFLFTTRTFVGVGFEAALAYRARATADPHAVDPAVEGRAAEARAAADLELLALLTDDLAARPLMLGHGAAKGFGWFKVTARWDGLDTGASDDG